MGYLVLFAVSLAVTTVVLLVSMMIVGQFLSIDFGDVKTVIAKSTGLIIVVSACHNVNLFLGLAVWIVGLMFLFRLGVVEAVVLALVNWVLSLVLIAAIVTAIVALSGGPAAA